MRVKEITVMCSRTVNLGNYESAKVEVSQVAEIGPTEDANAAFKELYNDTKRKLIDKIERLVS